MYESMLSDGIRDHPRLRGEHIQYGFKFNFTKGSPPPTRGTRTVGDGKKAYFGITPAYAGNTYSRYGITFSSKDHPRLRGEHELVKISEKIGAGSPPPTRGTLQNVDKLSIPVRITPAYAGNTFLRNPVRQVLQDHPRLRGEHKIAYVYCDADKGSPPPTRGTPKISKSVISPPRITPAYAGNTYVNNRAIIEDRDHPRLRGEHFQK